MRFYFLVSKCPEYCALRVRSGSLALLWQAGHAAMALSLLGVLGAVEVLLTAQMDSDLSAERSPWPIAGALMCWTPLCICVGIALKRYARRRAAVSVS